MTGEAPTDEAAPARARRTHLLDGTAWGLIAELLALPSGLVTVAFLSRVLGPDGYGRFSLALGVTVLLDGALASLLSRATIKFVSQAPDWRPVGRTVLRLNLLLASAAALVLAAIAPLLASLLSEPRLTLYLRVLAPGLPLAAAAQAHLHLLVGLGRYRARALARGARWTLRAVLVVGLVAAGFGVVGALVGSMGASAVELLAARRRVKPEIRGGGVPAGGLLTFGTPLFVAGMALAMLKKLDLFALKALGATAAEAGLYAGAQNLAMIPSLLSLASWPLLLSSINRALHEGRPDEAHALSREFARLATWLLPFAAVAAGDASGIMRLVYGPGFGPAGPALALLVFGGVASLGMAIVTSVHVALDRPRLMATASVASLLAAVSAYPFLIPRLGLLGAGAATLAGTLGGLGIGVALLESRWRPLPRPATVVRTAGVAALGFLASRAWPADGLVLLGKLAVLSLMVPAALALTGEVGRGEWARMKAVARTLTAGRGGPGR